YPTAFALWIAPHKNLRLLPWFFLGTILMRAAGCIINDIADRRWDAHVARTQQRPLVTGALSLIEAWVCLLLLLFLSFLVLLQLSPACFYWALAALGVVGLYPFTKRFLPAPQVILGIAFSMSIPMVYTAYAASMDGVTLLLWANTVLWVLSYDTMYAMVDKSDDQVLGLYSTAILAGEYDSIWVSIFGVLSYLSWLFIAKLLFLNIYFYAAWAGAGLLLGYQLYLTSTQQAQACFRAFSLSVWYGLLLWIGLCFNF
ncbi:MAG: 4-hydroxybenzoate octaprenyltransferase, partial [Legionellaceae bacterium]|nr:4-hydroxybenzoate octaprenyltransferase [Legionellaceae bacterium]